MSVSGLCTEYCITQSDFIEASLFLISRKVNDLAVVYRTKIFFFVLEVQSSVTTYLHAAIRTICMIMDAVTQQFCKVRTN